METYDKAMELTLNEQTVALFAQKELKSAGKVLIAQALLKEGYTVDAETNFHVLVSSDALKIRAQRGSAE